MHSQQISKGLATIVKALSKVDDGFRSRQNQGPETAPSTGKPADLSVYAHFIRENINIFGQSHSLQLQPVTLNEPTRKRFLNILNRAANGQEGVSRQERLFVQQVWSAIGAQH